MGRQHTRKPGTENGRERGEKAVSPPMHGLAVPRRSRVIPYPVRPRRRQKITTADTWTIVGGAEKLDGTSGTVEVQPTSGCQTIDPNANLGQSFGSFEGKATPRPKRQIFSTITTSIASNTSLLWGRKIVRPHALTPSPTTTASSPRPSTQKRACKEAGPSGKRSRDLRRVAVPKGVALGQVGRSVEQRTENRHPQLALPKIFRNSGFLRLLTWWDYGGTRYP